MTLPHRSSSRHTYKAVVSNDGTRESNDPLEEEEVGEENKEESLSSSSSSLSAAEKKNLINVIVLDSAQSRFPVAVSPDWTVERFKLVGAHIHKISPDAQRLIYRGRLLNNETDEEGQPKTLRHYGITQSDTIIHLFPKPQVVVVNNTNNNTNNNNNNTNNGDNPNNNNDARGRLEVDQGGPHAHIPQIIVDAQEAERRQQILILSSNEVFEAQHRVKLLCLLLLVMSSFELLTLVTMMLGGPETPESGLPTDGTMRTWQNTDYIDLIISCFGVYVATLGIKATTENTLGLARCYLYCLVLSGISWNAFFFFTSVERAKEESGMDDDVYNDSVFQDDTQDTSVYAQATLAMLLPLFVWSMCFVRAWQFQHLIHLAELEAQQRGIFGENLQVIEQDENVRLT